MFLVNAKTTILPISVRKPYFKSFISEIITLKSVNVASYRAVWLKKNYIQLLTNFFLYISNSLFSFYFLTDLKILILMTVYRIPDKRVFVEVISVSKTWIYRSITFWIIFLKCTLSWCISNVKVSFSLAALQVWYLLFETFLFFYAVKIFVRNNFQIKAFWILDTFHFSIFPYFFPLTHG